MFMQIKNGAARFNLTVKNINNQPKVLIIKNI